MLARHARALGRPKSLVARDWIMERPEREGVDRLIREAAALHGAAREKAAHPVEFIGGVIGRLDRPTMDQVDSALRRWLDL